MKKTLYAAGMQLILILLLIQPQVMAQEFLTADHIAKMQSVSGVDISNDGSTIAYTLSVPANPREENAPASNYLYVMNTETGEAVPYFTTGSVSGIDFRPGHSAVTFLAKRDGDEARALYEMSLSGGEAVKIFEFNQNIISYNWHSDGDHIAFTANEEAEQSDSPLPYSTVVFEENQTNRKGYITNISVEGHEPHQLPVEGSVYKTIWSPDGSEIAVSAAPTPNVDDYYMGQKVFVVDYKQQEITAEINNEGKLGQIVWSPDGEQLALRAGYDIHDPIDGRILLVSADGGTPEVVDEDFKGKYEHITWPEKNAIHFMTSEGTATSYGTIKPDGSRKRSVISSDTPVFSAYSRADNGAVAFEASSPQHPAEVYFKAPGSDSMERITHHNKWLEDIELGRQEVIRYEARDGEFEIEGLLIYPVDYEEGTRVPVIAQVHGGPEAHYSNGWVTAYSMPGQMAAGKGYAVFYPNYRGSTGRGIEFLYSSQADMAGKEFDDVVDGVDYLIDEGIADEDRIGVTGGSYGGYASAWMSTYYSDRFAASVMFVGISDNISKWGTSDIPEELYLVHARERIWEDWQGFLERSPIFHVDKAETPTLIMHGQEDTRVHPGQSLELHRHLKVRKPEVPLRLVFYPGEGHGNSRASSQYEYTLRMLRWFDTYLETGNRTAEKPHWDILIEE